MLYYNYLITGFVRQLAGVHDGPVAGVQRVPAALHRAARPGVGAGVLACSQHSALELSAKLHESVITRHHLVRRATCSRGRRGWRAWARWSRSPWSPAPSACAGQTPRRTRRCPESCLQGFLMRILRIYHAEVSAVSILYNAL